MSSMDRHISTAVPDYPLFLSELKKLTESKGEEQTAFISSEEHSKLKHDVREWLEVNIQTLVRAHPSTSLFSPASVRGHEKKDFSIYVGSGGNAYLHWRVSQFYEREKNAQKAAFHLKQAVEAVNVSLSLLPRQTKGGEGLIAFYIGNTGVHALAALIFWKDGQHAKALEQLKCVLNYLPNALDVSAQDEILYGRAGYLFCLKFVQKYIGSDLLKDLPWASAMRRVFDAIVESGKRGSSHKFTTVSSLQYDFYGSDYHGAAHGTSGILYMLLQFPEWCVDPSVQPWIKNTLDRMLSIQFASGNFPSSSDNTSDVLIHWCHGAPGFAYMLHQAYEVFKEEKFKSALESSLAVIWERGILKKGNGLCHGTAGNAYAFLMMFKHTGNEEHLYKAFKMAQAMWSNEVKKHVAMFFDPQRQCQGVPDFPYSLMEGLGGTICFCCDLLYPHFAAFPGYDGDV